MAARSPIFVFVSVCVMEADARTLQSTDVNYFGMYLGAHELGPAATRPDRIHAVFVGESHRIITNISP